jgi:hypothetical protein
MLGKHRELLRFAVVGGASFVITMTITYGLKFTVLTDKPVTALVLGVLVATVFSYVANRECVPVVVVQEVGVSGGRRAAPPASRRRTSLFRGPRRPRRLTPEEAVAKVPRSRRQAIAKVPCSFSRR